ncbi:hypothetical protein ADE_48600 [Achromobacter denitrificans]|nr:hypothetical protein ADE_48600 [Achromobacter denitrificans]
MILVRDAGSIRAVAACEAMTCPLVSSNRSQAFAVSAGAGTGCATAPDTHAAATIRLAANFFINISLLHFHAWFFLRGAGEKCLRAGIRPPRDARNWNMRGALGSLAAAHERKRDECHDILQEPL